MGIFPQIELGLFQPTRFIESGKPLIATGTNHTPSTFGTSAILGMMQVIVVKPEDMVFLAATSAAILADQFLELLGGESTPPISSPLLIVVEAVTAILIGILGTTLYGTIDPTGTELVIEVRAKLRDRGRRFLESASSRHCRSFHYVPRVDGHEREL